MAEGVFPKTDGEVLYDGDVNMLYNHGTIQEVYTDSGYDTTISGAVQSQENDYELTAITAADLSGMNYVKITMLGKTNVRSKDGYNGTVQLKIQTKDTGGSYSDSMVYRTTLEQDTANDETDIVLTGSTNWIHTLTDDEKTNGMQIKVFSKSTSGDSSQIQAGYVNYQTAIELKT
tara:strand:+ start:4235 stop:4759 length:525 start_codon:yes stop_codon:yes gene_type:complete